MGLLDGLKQVLGMKAAADATRDADPEDLFGMSTAYLTMEAALGYAPEDDAALCFGDVDSVAFQRAVEAVEDILEAGKEETGTIAEFHEDDHGYRWIVLEDEDFEDLVTTVHFAADTLVERGFGSRLLAAVFAFHDESVASRREGRAYWIYSFRRGSFYPFAPRGQQQRDETAEFKLVSELEGELDVEDDESYWYPLWPDRPGFYPWE